jgi:hypothetical protein
MKKFLAPIAFATLAVFSASVLAANPTPTGRSEITKPATPAGKAAKPAEPAATPAPKLLLMWAKADVIDVKNRTFTHTNKDGTVVKFVVTDATEIKNGDVPAKFEDIKVNDMVSGLRIKKSPTEYEIVKITKFGPRDEKDAKITPKPTGTVAPGGPAPKKKKD